MLEGLRTMLFEECTRNFGAVTCPVLSSLQNRVQAASQAIFETLAPAASVRRFLLTETLPSCLTKTLKLCAISSAIAGGAYLAYSTGHWLSLESEIGHEIVIQGSPEDILHDGLIGGLVTLPVTACVALTLPEIMARGREALPESMNKIAFVAGMTALSTLNILAGKYFIELLSLGLAPIQEDFDKECLLRRGLLNFMTGLPITGFLFVSGSLLKKGCYLACQGVDDYIRDSYLSFLDWRARESYREGEADSSEQARTISIEINPNPVEPDALEQADPNPSESALLPA